MFLGQALRARGQLPVETTSFVGREAELARLSALLSRARLVTVTGPGGVGKTRLALRAAAKAAPGFADGACLAELATVAEPGLLVPAVAGVLGVAGPARGALLDAVLAHLADRQLLLILDTCEHLIDACAMFAEAVIARAPRVTMLATSREPLDVSGENACPVAPLPVPRRSDAGTPAGTAVELFIQRASAAVPGYAFTPDDLPQVIRLCRRLDGIPLAIELAAVRLRALPLAELASRLDQRLALLASGHGARHRTLRDAIGWSYDLCTPAEQALWARLSVFGGPFTMGAAEEVCAGELGPGQVMPALIRLVDKSILVRAGQTAVRLGHTRVRRRPAHQVPDARHLPRVRRGSARRLGRRGGYQAALHRPLPGHGRSACATTSSTTTSSAGCGNCGASTTTSGPRSTARSAARRPQPARAADARRGAGVGGTASSSPPHCSTTGAAVASLPKAASGSARPSRARPRARPPAAARCSRAATCSRCRAAPTSRSPTRRGSSTWPPSSPTAR